MSNLRLPMMPWYPDQFAASTRLWSFEERGLYRALLDLQWQSSTKSLPNNCETLAKVLDIHLRVYKRLWKTVSSKFDVLPDGSLQNPRLEYHRTQCLEYREKRSAAGRKGNAVRWHSDRSAIANAIPERSPLSLSLTEEEHPPYPPQGGATKNTNGNGNGRSPRRLAKDASREAWAKASREIARVKATATLPQTERLTWAYVREHVDTLTWYAIESAGGCLVIADRDRFTASEIEGRFREAYELLSAGEAQ